MSIPLDRLYHYIEDVAESVRGDNVVIYRFYPHGSKNIEDLTLLNLPKFSNAIAPPIVCYDQEPLSFANYQSLTKEQCFPSNKRSEDPLMDLIYHCDVELPDYNLKYGDSLAFYHIYDQAILLHSEQRSADVELYSDHGFIPVYYWNHALLARDWFRYAQHANFKKTSNTKMFLIYNRAWTGTREYRLKLADLLIEHNLVDHCLTSVSYQDNHTSYQDHEFSNPLWRPKNQLENYFKNNTTTSCYSADFEEQDYQQTQIEIVLETLFDDQRLHLTEKILRPIACGQPFVLAGTEGSLKYLKTYGFKTFSEVIDESYDTVADPYMRLQHIVQVMKNIASWNDQQKTHNLKIMQDIANYNQQHFFSNDFTNQVCNELKINLAQGFDQLEATNTSQRWLELRKLIARYPSVREYLTRPNPFRQRQDIVSLLKTAKSYTKNR